MGVSSGSEDREEEWKGTTAHQDFVSRYIRSRTTPVLVLVGPGLRCHEVNEAHNTPVHCFLVCIHIFSGVCASTFESITFRSDQGAKHNDGYAQMGIYTPNFKFCQITQRGSAKFYSTLSFAHYGIPTRSHGRGGWSYGRNLYHTICR
jgi:hypothetical protein